MAEGTIHPITDPGRRLSEAVDRARQTGGAGRFIAVSMADGDWSGDVYDTKADAIRHTDESLYCYLMVPLMPMPPAEATAWIALHRKLLEQGWKMTDPGAPVPIPSLAPPLPPVRPGVRPSGLVIPQQRRGKRR
jgi:hypothetical protein